MKNPETHLPFLPLIAALALLVGCESQPLILIPAPIIYLEGGLDPHAHLTPEERTTEVRVFYATDRVAQSDPDGPPYGNRPDTVLHLGEAVVSFGGQDMTWEQLHAASIGGPRTGPIPIRLDRVAEEAAIPIKEAEGAAEPPDGGVAAWLDDLNAAIAAARDRDLVIYVHGTKVDFENGCAHMAECRHFSSRDYVGLAYSWPSHQNIFSYVWGPDAEQSIRSSASLRRLLEVLSTHTRAERFHLLAYSAGGHLTARALADLRQAHADLSDEEVKDRFRLGTVFFAASDVPLDEFLMELPSIHALADDVVVTLSDADNALESAVSFMGGQVRIGEELEELPEEERELLHQLSRVEMLDVSYGKEERGFDITGHHYWYRHPWVTSDVVISLRTGLPAAQRGLLPTHCERFWYFPPDYPERARAAFRAALGD